MQGLVAGTLATVGVGSLLVLASPALGTSRHDVFFVGHSGGESATAAVKQSGRRLVVEIALQCQSHGLPTSEDLPSVKVAPSGKFSDSGTATYIAGFDKKKKTQFRLTGSLKSWSRSIKLGSLKSVSVNVKPTAGCPSFSGKLAKEKIPPAS